MSVSPRLTVLALVGADGPSSQLYFFILNCLAILNIYNPY